MFEAIFSNSLVKAFLCLPVTIFAAARAAQRASSSPFRIYTGVALVKNS